MAGYPKDQLNINNVVGELAREMNRRMRLGQEFKIELDAYTDTQLTNAGYSAGEVSQLRALASDLDQLASIYRGAATLGTVKDFRQSLRPLWGVIGDY